MDLSFVSSVGDHIWIVGNDDLPNLAGLEGITSIDGYLNIRNNPSLTSLWGVNNIQAIGGYVEIRENDILENLTGLDELNSVGGSFTIRDNPNLQDISALQNLGMIGGELRILINNLLSSLDGLQNISAASISDLYIHDNNMLSLCEVESVCNYLASPNGAIYIVNNAFGCNSQQEVEDACFSDIPEYISNSGFSIAPNPLYSTLTIGLAIPGYRTVKCDLFEISGRKIKTLLNEIKSPGYYEITFDLSDLEPGIYLCTLNTSDGIQTRKIIKL
jgi:hypothetical protein